MFVNMRSGRTGVRLHMLAKRPPLVAIRKFLIRALSRKPRQSPRREPIEFRIFSADIYPIRLGLQSCSRLSHR
jgi:hypothetical protein